MTDKNSQKVHESIESDDRWLVDILEARLFPVLKYLKRAIPGVQSSVKMCMCVRLFNVEIQSSKYAWCKNSRFLSACPCVCVSV